MIIHRKIYTRGLSAYITFLHISVHDPRGIHDDVITLKHFPHCQITICLEDQIDGVAQDCGNSIANALKLPHSCANLSEIASFHIPFHFPYFSIRIYLLNSIRFHFLVFYLAPDYGVWKWNIIMTHQFIHLGPDDTHAVIIASGTWWRHQMETFSALLALCAVKSPVTG